MVTSVMSDPLVSICIPCRNAGDYLSQAIDSILSQTWANIEIIVVDDGSTDSSRDVLRSYSHSRLLIIHGCLGSAAKSRNLAYKSAQGDFIKFFDADDILCSDAITSQMQRLLYRVDAVASSPWGRFYRDDLNTFKPNPQRVWRDMNALDWLVESWRDAQPMMQPGMFLIPRPLLEKAGGWDESLTLIDDFEFFARLFCSASDILFAQNATLYYRSGIPGSLSGQKSDKAILSAYHSLLKGTQYLHQKRPDPQASLSCANILQQFVYEVYPDHADLLQVVQKKIDDLGGSQLAVPGGPRFQHIRRLLGWKITRRIQKLLSQT